MQPLNNSTLQAHLKLALVNTSPSPLNLNMLPIVLSKQKHLPGSQCKPHMFSTMQGSRFAPKEQTHFTSSMETMQTNHGAASQAKLAGLYAGIGFDLQP